MQDIEGGAESLEDRVQAVGQAAIYYAGVLEAFETGEPVPERKGPKLSEALDLIDARDLTEKQTEATEYFRGIKKKDGTHDVNPTTVRKHAQAFLNPETK